MIQLIPLNFNNLFVKKTLWIDSLASSRNAPMSMGANGSPGSSIQQMPFLFLALLHCPDEQESVE